MTKRLIVNADDFGWSRGVNRGILQAHTQGILTSTTLLVNFPAMEDALSLSADHPKLGIGLHFNIVHGPPLSPPDRIPSLLDRSGYFAGSASMFRRLMSRQVSTKHVQLEFEAQLTRFREFAGNPTHIDSHKHMHLFGSVRDAIAASSRDLAGTPIRSTQRAPGRSRSATLKFRILQHLGKRARATYDRSGFAATDDFIGLDQLGEASPERSTELLASTGAGITELMCHPGLPSDDEHSVVRNVSVTEVRQRELATLTDPTLKEYVTREGIERINYSQVS
jgi:predicted glycoside hydrolase/deacetylase ChbG (UPF0249 family)